MMKKNATLIFVLMIATSVFSQRLYDNGPIIVDNTNYSLGASKWNKNNLTYYIYNSSNHLTSSERETAIQNAFQTWSNNSTLSFTQLSSPDNADIKIKWVSGDHGDGYPFDGTGGSPNVFAHAFYPAPAGGVYAGQLHFDDAEDWSVNGSGIDLETVALHEIGHLLGIAHSEVYGSIMYPTYNTIRRSLSVDDCQAIWDLYGYNFYILGNSHVCNSQVFTIKNLPNGANVTWGFLYSSSTSMLQANVPANNQCTLSNPNSYYVNDYIVATISKNGQSLRSLQKYVYAYLPFYGTYTQTLTQFNKYGYYAIPETNFTANDAIIVNPDCYIFIKSSKFKNMTMSCVPHNYSTALISRIDDETIKLYVNYERLIRYGTVTVYGTSPEGCDDFSFTVYVTADKNFITPLLTLCSNIENGTLSISLNSCTESLAETNLHQCSLSGWDIIITECTKGQRVYTKSCQNDKLRIDISQWKHSIYSIQAINGKQVIYKKIWIK